MSLQYAVSRRLVGSHCTPGGGGVTPPLGINEWGVIQPGESLIPLTTGLYCNRDVQSRSLLHLENCCGPIKFMKITTLYSNVDCGLESSPQKCVEIRASAFHSYSERSEAILEIFRRRRRQPEVGLKT